jgi:hypothetical protein
MCIALWEVIRSPRKDWVKLVFSNNTVYEQRTTG